MTQGFLTNFLSLNKIRHIASFYATLIGIFGVLVVTGIIEVNPQLNFVFLEPVVYINAKGLVEALRDSKFAYLVKDIEKYGDGKIEIGMPTITKKEIKKIRIMSDSKKIHPTSLQLRGDFLKYELGWSQEMDYWLGIVPDTGLRLNEDRRIGVSVFVMFNSMNLFNEKTYKASTREDYFKLRFDTISNLEEGSEPLFTYLLNRKVYNIISLENRSNQKINSIILKLNSSYPSYPVEALAWTYSTELIEIDTSTANLTVFKIPFLRPRTSVEFVIRSTHLYKSHDISLEWDKLRNLDKNKITKWFIGFLLFTILLTGVDYYRHVRKCVKNKNAK